MGPPNYSKVKCAKLLPDISSKSEQDLQRLIQVFPEELWLLVFDKIKDSSLLITVAKASLCFQIFLEPRRVKYLLPQVLPLIAPNLGFGLPHRQSDESYDFPYQFIQRIPPHWYATLTQMRRVCSSWQQDVDHYFATLRLRNKMNHNWSDVLEDPNENQHNFAEMMESYTFRYTNLGKLRQFVEHFQNTHEQCKTRNPFIARTIRLDDTQYQIWRRDMPPLRPREVRQRSKRLRKGFTCLLIEYGHHIWHSRITITEAFCTEVYHSDYVKRIRQWLELMPNLQVLDIWYHNQKLFELLEDMKNEDRPNMKALETVLAEKSFPKLVNLKCLKIVRLPTPVLNNLLANNRHITSLEIYGDKFQEYDQLGLISNLELLSLYYGSITALENFDKISYNFVKLTKLHLQFNCIMADVESNGKFWKRYMEIVCKHWGKSSTLEELSLYSPKDEKFMKEYLECANVHNLKLPQVKRFKFLMYFPCLMEFFKFCRDSLETLQLYQRFPNLPSGVTPIWYENAVGERASLEFECKVGVANIFDYFPKLEKVYLSGQEGRPHTYEYSRQDGGIWNRVIRMKL